MMRIYTKYESSSSFFVAKRFGYAQCPAGHGEEALCVPGMVAVRTTVSFEPVQKQFLVF